MRGWNYTRALILCLVLSGFAQGTWASPKKPAPANPAEKYDTKLPVEISSDNLEVLQHENKAIFKGHVIAVQGKIRLTSDVMIVHYRQKSDQPGASQSPKPAPVAGPAAQGSMGAITLIEVENNVFMATPEESAKGDKGNYQVDEKLLHLTGDNVVLTRGKNILRGTDLVYNLETGRSVLTNKGAKVGGPNGGRVHSVFVPNEDDKVKEKPKKNKAAPADAAPIPSP